MPIYVDSSDESSAAVDDPCDWLVVPLRPGTVSLCTSSRFSEPTAAMTFTRATLPQLREIVALLEREP